jgi:hypothetical protein
MKTDPITLDTIVTDDLEYKSGTGEWAQFQVSMGMKLRNSRAYDWHGRGKTKRFTLVVRRGARGRGIELPFLPEPWSPSRNDNNPPATTTHPDR